MQLLASYLSGAWSAGAGPTVPLVNPATEAVLAEVHTGGHDLAAAFRYARTTGGGELGQLGFAQRGARLLADGEPIQVGRTARMGGQHVWARRAGVAVHINAFNFPGWGLCEKLACTLLAGMPVIAKPATATALVAHRMTQLFAPVLPAGALQLLVGPAGALLDQLGPGDVVAFTGGNATARMLRDHPVIVAHGVRLNLEADSLNAAVLAPDVELTGDA